jgi:hypothetical protein
MKYPVLIYCTKAKPYLLHECIYDGEFVKPYRCTDDEGAKEESLNGLVCFECECKKRYDMPLSYNSSYGVYCRTIPFRSKTILRRSGLSSTEFSNYGEGKTLYALHFGKIKAVKSPYGITGLYSDPDCTKPLKRAPQSWGYAYRRTNVYDRQRFDQSKWDLKNLKTDGRYYFKVERVLVFSIRSTWCCKYGNGEKDLEIRTTCPKELLSIQGAGR